MKKNRQRKGGKKFSFGNGSQRLGKSISRRPGLASFEQLELRALLTGSDVLCSRAFLASSFDDNNDPHVSPLSSMSISDPQADQQADSAAPPAANPYTSVYDTSYESSSPDVSPLATAEEAVVKVRVEVQDLNGNSISNLQSGQEFRLAVYVDDNRADAPNAGVFAAFVNVAYDPSLVSVAGNAQFGGIFNHSGATQNTSTAGVIRAGSFGNSLSAPGTAEQLLFTIKMQANATGNATFTPSHWDADDTLVFGNDDAVAADDIFYAADQLAIGSIPSVSVGNVTKAEGNSGTTEFLFTVSLSAAATQQVTVVYGTGSAGAGSATASTDYVPQVGTLTFAPGDTSKVITVLVNGDTAIEADETFSVTLTNPVNATLGTAQGIGTITNDDVPVIDVVGVEQLEEDEQNSLVFTVTISQPSPTAILVPYQTVDGSATAGSDYVATSGTLTFAPNTTTAQTVTVTINGDNVNEANENFRLKLTAPTGAVFGESEGEAVATLLNDDGPFISFEQAQVSANEGNSGTAQVPFVVTLGNSSDVPITVRYATQDVTATAGSDYVATSGTLTFAPGTTSQTVMVTINGDALNEPNETFTLNLSDADGATIAQAQATATIQNDDALPEFSFQSNTISVEEGNSGTKQVLVTVNLSAASGQVVTVQYATENGSATSGSDYQAITTSTLTFSPGETQKVITVTVNGDALNEADETFKVNLFNSTNAGNAQSVEQKLSATVTIEDEDAAPTISISDVTKAEGNSGTTPFQFTVTLSAASGQVVTVGYNVTNGTATPVTDLILANGVVTFNPGETSKVITVIVNGDTETEPDETFSVVLASPTNATIAKGTGAGVIANDDGQPTLSIGNAGSQNEGNSGTTSYLFTVTLSSASAQQVTVAYATNNGTATGTDNDFVAQTGTLTFAPGETSKVITVAVNGDTRNEADETFHVTLSSASNATILGATGQGVIVNDDAQPALSISDVSQAEGDSGTTAFVFTVTLSAASGQQVTVAYNTANGTATTGNNDYTAASGTLTFAPGETSKTITVQVVGDKFDEGNETFTVNLTNAQNATVSKGSGTGTIQDETTDDVVVVPSKLSGRAFVDSNNNGVMDGNEKPLAGVTVTLTGAVNGSAVNRSTTTAADGSYSFDNLDPGNYVVRFTQPERYMSGVTLIGSQGGTVTGLSYAVTIPAAGGVTGVNNNFTTRGLQPQFLSMRMFVASQINGVADPDNVAPQVSISSVTNPINSVNQKSTTVSGTGSAGASIQVVASDGTKSSTAYTTTVGANGTWTINGVDVSSLSDGTITYTATVTKDGLSSTATISATKDTTAPALAINTVTSPINNANRQTTSVSGTAAANATVSVIASDGNNSTVAKTATADGNGNWTISSIDVSGLADGTITYTATSKDGAGNTATATKTTTKDTVAPAVAITAGTSTINGDNQGNTTVSGTGEVGATISVVASNGSNSTAAKTTAVAQDGTWSISGIDVTSLADGTITYTATATDGAGNTATATRTATKDTADPTVAITGGTTIINNANKATTTINGTGQEGATISVVASNGGTSTPAKTTTVAADGTWSIIDIDVSSLADGTITYTVTSTDGAGNTATATRTVTKDTVAPAVAATGGTAVVNSANQGATTISGTGEHNATISVIVSDGTNSTTAQTTTVAEDGTWSISVIDVSGLADGTLTYTVTATDAAGNTAQTTRTVTKDTVAPAVDATQVTNPITMVNHHNTTISGTGEQDATISVIVSDGTNNSTAYTTTVGEDGTWSISGIDVSGLADGTLTYTVTATDEAGNTAQDTITAEKNTVAIVSVTDPINIANKATVTISGTGHEGATVVVVASDGTNHTIEYTTEIAEDGTWSISGIDVSGLNDGTITFTATASDGEENSATTTKTALKDTVAPEVAIVEFTEVVNLANADSASISGTGEVGATITVVITDSEDGQVTVTTTVGEDETWSIASIDLTSLLDGPITYTVTATDGAGNPTTVSETATKDTVAPEIEIGSHTESIGLANQTAASISGTVEVGSTVKVVASNGGNSTTEYTATVAEDGSWSINNLDVSTLADGTITFTVTATDAAGNTTQVTVTAQKATVVVTTISPINGETKNNVTVSGTGQIGATITLVVSDGTNSTEEFTTTVDAEGNWSISGVDVSGLNEGNLTFTATADDGEGHTATSTKSALKDTVAPEVALNALTSAINAAAAGNLTVSGTGEPDAQISLVVNDGTNSTTAYTTTVAEDGTWSISGIDVSALDDGTLTFTVTASDAVGNETTVSDDADKDTVAPALTVDAPEYLNFGTVYGFDIGGTGEVGAIVSVIVSDGTETTDPYTATVDGNGDWEIHTIDVAGQADGALVITVKITDAAGNQTVQTVTVTKDTIPPAVNIVSVPEAVGLANQTSVSASGTAEIGSTIRIAVTDGTNEPVIVTDVPVDEEGNWSVSGIDLSGLLDGTLTFAVTATDTAGNEKHVTATTTKATVAVTTVTSPINAENADSLTVSGTGEVGATITLVVSDGTSSTEELTATVDGEGHWLISGVDVSGLDDATLTFTATADDGEGHTDTSSKTALKDTVAPEVTLSTVTDPIDAENATSVAASGTGEIGATISLVVSDGTHSTEAVTTTVDGEGNWSLAGINVSALSEGTLTFTATASDAAGNTATSTKTAEATGIGVQTEALVVQDGTTLRITGTAGDDHFVFVAGEVYTITINGQEHQFDPATVTDIIFDGGDGYDSADLTGSSDGEFADFTLGSGTLAGIAFSVSVNNAEAIAVYGGGGDDAAALFDSALGDHLHAAGDAAILTNSAGLTTSINGFANVTAISSEGGEDTIQVDAIDYVLEQEGPWTAL